MSTQPREAGGVLSFTFLDVLTCTMGSLVLLVVVLGEKAADTRLEDALRNGPQRGHTADKMEGEAPAEPERRVPALGSTGVPAPQSKLTDAEAAAQLKTLQQAQKQLADLRKTAAERVNEEKARVSHLEEHQRRLEHELAQLHITLERLEEAEQRQNVDQATAEASLKRLKQLITDTQKQLDALRAEPSGKKSYAIVPYRGKSGTHRRPIYVECTADAVIIQPEGIKLTPWDFKGPIRSGNPLASAMRAAREELNERAKLAGEQEMPEAYPLILVRPDAPHTYRAVVTAVDSWDMQYGYELIEADWELEYPEPDPRLAQVMVHAVEQARERQALLAKAAPRTYSSVPARFTSGDFREEGGDMGGGPISVNGSPGASSRITTLQTPGEELSADSQRPASEANFLDEVAAGGSAETRPGQINSGADSRQAAPDQFGAAGGGAAAPSPLDALAASSQAPASAMPSPGIASASGAGMSATPAPDVHAMETAARGASPEETPNNAVHAVDASQQADSAAMTRGSNWANVAATRRSAPITRPVKVVIHTEQLDVIAESDGAGPTPPPHVITFNQPTAKVLDDLADAVKHHIESWGPAGKSMYWRPTLVLRVSPGAERHAIRIRDLLRDSGVDVQFQDVETAERPTGGG